MEIIDNITVNPETVPVSYVPVNLRLTLLVTDLFNTVLIKQGQ